MLTALRANFRQVSNVLQEGIDSGGGYLVLEEYDSRLIDGLTEENIMRRLGHRITTSGEHKINIAAAKPAATWIDEGGALTFGDATFAQISLDAHKLHVAVKVTEEPLYDNAFGLERYIIAQFSITVYNRARPGLTHLLEKDMRSGAMAESAAFCTLLPPKNTP